MFKVAVILDESKADGKSTISSDYFGADVYVFTVDEVLNKLSKSKTSFDILLLTEDSNYDSRIYREKSSKVAKALDLSTDQTISIQELSTENTSKMLNLKQLSYSMPKQVPQDWLEAGVRWDSIRSRA